MMRVGARGQNGPASPDLSALRHYSHAGTARFEAGDGGALVDESPPAPGLALQAENQLHRVEDRSQGIEERSLVARASHFRLDLVAREEAQVGDAQALRTLDVRLQVLDLPGLQGHVQRTRPLQIALDAVRVEEAQHLREVLLAEAGQALRLGEAEVGDPETVGVVDALAEHPRVASARAVGGSMALEDHDGARWFHLQEADRGPESREAGAHHDHVGRSAATQRRIGLSRVSREPVAGLLDGGAQRRSGYR